MDILIQKLTELIFDENRIVSYKTLSKSCCVHVNTAKEALGSFLKSTEDLNATYLLAGFIGEGESRSYHVAVVPAAKLEDMKAKFTQLDACHVYSLQKTVIKDSGLLYCENKFQGKTSPKAAIRNSCLSKSRRVSPIVPPPSQPETKDERKVCDIPATNDVEKADKPKQNDSQSKPKAVAKKNQANGKGGKGIMAAFAKGTSTAKKPAAKTESPKLSAKDEKTKPIQNGSKSPEEKVKILKKAEKQMWSDSESSEDEEPIPTKKSKTLSRIKQLPESDSEDEPEKKEKPESVLSPEVDEEPETSPQEQMSMQLVSVFNTYQDEDGNLVTQKQHKMEEVKVTDAKPPPPKNAGRAAPNNPAKKKSKKSPPEDSKKQASLMSFFTRK